MVESAGDDGLWARVNRAAGMEQSLEHCDGPYDEHAVGAECKAFRGRKEVPC